MKRTTMVLLRVCGCVLLSMGVENVLIEPVSIGLVAIGLTFICWDIFSKSMAYLSLAITILLVDLIVCSAPMFKDDANTPLGITAICIFGFIGIVLLLVALASDSWKYKAT